MGIDLQALNMLRYAYKFGDFNKTVTIGRQSLDLTEPVLRHVLQVDSKYNHEEFCEQLLKEYFHSHSVDSIDVSNYENASIVTDMNNPLPENLRQQYDTVIDSGTLEHIYNISQALENCSFLCKPGGQIIHMLPANNYCGHGFWQVSPELFFSLYTNENGYRDTEVFLTYISQQHEISWYKVKKPENGERINIYSSKGIYVFVRTVLNQKIFLHKNIQQSDYIFLWNKDNIKQKSKWELMINKLISRHKYLNKLLTPFRLIRSLYSFYSEHKLSLRLSSANPHLIKTNISSLLLDDEGKTN